MAACIHCKRPIKAGAKFCSSCGKTQQAARPTHCTNPACGAPLEEGDAFCGECGQAIASGGAATTSRPESRLCTECQHYRVAAPISTQIRAPGAKAQEAL